MDQATLDLIVGAFNKFGPVGAFAAFLGYLGVRFLRAKVAAQVPAPKPVDPLHPPVDPTVAGPFPRLQKVLDLIHGQFGHPAGSVAPQSVPLEQLIGLKAEVDKVIAEKVAPLKDALK